MIELTEELVYEAIRRAKIDQDKIMEKAKEEQYGSKASRTSHLSDERTYETI